MQTAPRIHKTEVAALFALALVIVFTYLNIGDHTFLYWDDVDNISNNRHLEEINFSNLKWIFTSLDQIMWIPLTSLSHMLTIVIFGKNALAFIAINVLIHIFNSILVYFITKETLHILIANKTINPVSTSNINTAAFITSLIFAVNPMHVESVAWIIERKDVLCGFFYFSAILAYVKYLNDKNNILWYITILSFLFSLASKSMAVMLPFILTFIDIFFYNNPQFKSVFSSLFVSLRKLSLLYFTSIMFTVVTFITQKAEIHDLKQIGFVDRIINIAESILHYISKLLLPVDLTPFYPMPDYNGYPIAVVTAILILFLLMTLILFRLYTRNKPIPALAAMYFIIAIFPVLGIVKIGFAAYADRYTYIPSLSIHMVIGYFLMRIVMTPKIKTVKVLHLIITSFYLISLLYLSKNYLNVWKDDEVLWSKVIHNYPYQSDLAYVNYGNVLYRKRNYQQAVYNYHIALAINPKLIEAINNLASYNQMTGNRILASYYYSIMTERNPFSANAHIVSGDYFYNIREMNKADYNYRTALKLAPGNEDIIFKVAVMDYVTLHKEDASKKIDNILRLNPNHLGALQLKTKLEFDSKHSHMAHEYALRVLKLDPTDHFANFVVNSHQQ